MPISLESKVEIWSSEVDALVKDDYYMEVTGAFIVHDTIQKALDTGRKLNPAYEAILREADDRLMAQREDVVARFPEVFWPERQEAGPRSYWWWFLNEGPQVRNKAQAA